MFSDVRLVVFCLSAFLVFCALSADHPPSASAAAYAPGELPDTDYGCALHDGFVPIPHTGRDYLLELTGRLAPAAGEDPAAYSVDVIRETHGPEYINAMTCANSKVVWVSRKAYGELYGYEPALAYLMAHEIGHGSHRSVRVTDRDPMGAAERQLRSHLNHRQRHEVAVDQRAAEIMLAAGFTTEEVLAGARYILWQDGADLILNGSPSHPRGWDRLALLRYYLNRRPQPAAPVANRVLPRY